MRVFGRWLVWAVVFWGVVAKLPSGAQVDHIVIAAGMPEDHDLQSITGEQDATKKLAMYADFVQKYVSNPAAVAYGNWQISQAYQASGDFQKGLDYGDKALAGSPHNLDILVGQASMAQHLMPTLPCAGSLPSTPPSARGSSPSRPPCRHPASAPALRLPAMPGL